MCDGEEPISDDEILFRRVSSKQVDSGHAPKVAFRPKAGDVTGLSLFRAKYNEPTDIAPSTGAHPYYVATFRAGDLRRAGMTLVLKQDPNTPGHVEIPELTHAGRREVGAEELQFKLAHELCIELLGPFDHHLPNA